MDKIYKIICEWEVPLANGYFKTKEGALEAISNEDWTIVDYSSAEEVLDDGYVNIEEINVK